jgi:hypothetical protein
MATLRRGLVDKVKKVAAKAGTRGARALVETTAAAVKTVDKLQAKLGRHSAKAPATQESVTENEASAPITQKATSKASGATATKASGATATKASASKASATTSPEPKTRRTPAEAPPMVMREGGRKTMPAAAPKRSKVAAQAPGFKVKRGQKHRHTGR